MLSSGRKYPCEEKTKAYGDFEHAVMRHRLTLAVVEVLVLQQAHVGLAAHPNLVEDKVLFPEHIS